jgi:hypothetical protein
MFSVTFTDHLCSHDHDSLSVPVHAEDFRSSGDDRYCIFGDRPSRSRGKHMRSSAAPDDSEKSAIANEILRGMIRSRGADFLARSVKPTSTWETLAHGPGTAG